jgi:hypothetical protein
MLPYSLLEEIIRLDAEIDETSNDPEITFMRGYQKAHNDIWDMFCKVLKDDTLQRLDETYGLNEMQSIYGPDHVSFHTTRLSRGPGILLQGVAF